MINPIVSVIVPIYNAESTLRKCIDSILSQSFKNIELWLIEDGSIDRCSNICREYELIDSRVKAIYQENKGVSYSRNLGIAKSNGKYIQFVDADDWLNQEMITNLVNSMNESTDLVICGYNVINASLDNVSQYERCVKNTIELDLANFLDQFSQFYEIGLLQAVWNKMYRKDIIFECKLSFDKNLSLGEDMLFNINYFRSCRKISLKSDVLYNYTVCQYANSLSKIYNPKRLNSQITMYKSIIDLLNEYRTFSSSNYNCIKKYYSSSIISSINEYLTYDQCVWTEKIQFIKHLLKKNDINNNIVIVYNNSKWMKFTALLMKIRMIYLLMILLYFNEKFRMIRKGVLT
jgi:glycosyltransferase EpsJ